MTELTEYEALFGADTVASLINGVPLNIAEKAALADHTAARILKMPTETLAQILARLINDGANNFADILLEELTIRAMKGEDK